jgi:ribulose-phosphate 3-epimerase
MIKVSPSVLAADFSRLLDEVKSIEAAGADMVHLDVMDGMFVTNISFGLPVIASLRKNTDMFFDVHLMIDRPERYIARFIEAGADLVTFHYEATADSASSLDLIHSYGKMAGISVKPGTPVEEIYPLLDKCDLVLIMTVEPGYGGQAFIPETLDKIKNLKTEIDSRGLNIDIQVDGGINEETAKLVKEAGANNLVAGSYVFKAKDRKNAIDLIKK